MLKYYIGKLLITEYIWDEYLNIKKMKLTPHQKTVICLINQDLNKQVTKSRVCEEIRFYHNTEHYVGEILSRMVKMGYIRRIKNGLYGVGSGMRAIEEIKNQTKMF